MKIKTEWSLWDFVSENWDLQVTITVNDKGTVHDTLSFSLVTIDVLEEEIPKKKIYKISHFFDVAHPHDFPWKRTYFGPQFATLKEAKTEAEKLVIKNLSQILNQVKELRK